MEAPEAFISTIRDAEQLAWKVASRGQHVLFPGRDYVTYRGTRLPARELRFNGSEYQEEAYLLASADAEARRVVEKLGYDPTELLVDLGCGQGRLAIGLGRLVGAARYLGLDVSARSIAWCNEHIRRRDPSYRFHHLDLVNARYNPYGARLSDRFRLPVDDDVASIVFLWGVVTNMEPEHLAVYASEIHRILRPGGKAFFTANLEQDVPAVSINPANYVSFEYHGPLNIVRYEEQYFLEVLERAGLVLEQMDYHASAHCQSDLYFSKSRFDGHTLTAAWAPEVLRLT